MSWAGVIAATLACIAAKQVGALAPTSWLAGARLGRYLPWLPVAMLSTLIAIATFGLDGRWVLDERAAAMAVAALATWRRAPFPVVILLAATTAALLRAVA